MLLKKDNVGEYNGADWKSYCPEQGGSDGPRSTPTEWGMNRTLNERARAIRSIRLRPKKRAHWIVLSSCGQGTTIKQLRLLFLFTINHYSWAEEDGAIEFEDLLVERGWMPLSSRISFRFICWYHKEVVDPVNAVLCLAFALPCSNGLRGIALCRMRALRLDSYPVKLSRGFGWPMVGFWWRERLLLGVLCPRPRNRKKIGRSFLINRLGRGVGSEMDLGSQWEQIITRIMLASWIHWNSERHWEALHIWLFALKEVPGFTAVSAVLPKTRTWTKTHFPETGFLQKQEFRKKQ